MKDEKRQIGFSLIPHPSSLIPSQWTLLSLLGAALLFLSGCKNDFKPFDIPQTRATVSLPRPFTSRQEPVPGDGTVTVFAHEDQNNGSYLVSAYRIPKRTDDSSRPEKERLLEEAGKAIKSRFQVPDDKWSPVDLTDKLLGIEVSFEIPDRGQQVRTRLYLVDGMLYTLTIVGTSKWVDSQESRIFLTSLKFKQTSESGTR